MDVSRFKVSDWLMVAAGAAMLLFGLALKWASVDGVGVNYNAFDYFFTGGLAWILVVGSGVVAFLLAGGMIKAGTTPWGLILVAATGLATLLMLLRLIIGGGDVAGFDLSRGPGMYLSFIAAAVALAGAVMNYTASGGNLRDLTDRDKLRKAFDRPRGASPPPPPPPTGQAPPPPPSR